MNSIYNYGKDNIGDLRESPNKEPGYTNMRKPNIQSAFVETLSKHICDILEINQSDRRITGQLLSREIGRELIGDSKLLNQFLAHELDVLAEELKDRFEIKKEDKVEVDHRYSTHAKFSSIANYVTKNFVKIDSINNDGTFETIFDQQNSACMAVDGDCCEEDRPSSESPN